MLLDTETIHYNPTGPGDYNLPSSFGQLPPPRKKSQATLGDQSVLATKPRFSIGGRINDGRVFENNLNALHGKGAPPLGLYEPVNPRAGGFEDKAKLDMIRAKRWNPDQSRNSATLVHQTEVANEAQDR